MKGFSLSKRRAAIGALVAVGAAALVFTVLPAIGGPIGGNIPPASNAGVMPTEADTGGQSNDCALFGFPASQYSSYRIDTPKSQSYNAGGGVTFTLSVAATGSNKDKYFDYIVNGAAVYAVGVKGGSNSAKYAYPATSPANVAKWPAFAKPGDKALYSDARLHAPAQSVDSSGNPTQLYSVSNVTFCFKKSATVSGVVFNDVNSDGLSTGESGIGGATVTLYDGTTPVGDPFTTLADGVYSFSGLSIGKTYTVCQTSLGTNWTRTVPVATTAGTVDCPDTTRGYSVTPVGNVPGLNFGNVQTASIQGRVFVDADADGAPDAGEGVSAQTVTVRKGSFSRSATFGTDGAFTILGVPVGTGYTLCVAGSASLRQIVPVTPAGTACSVEGTRGYSIDLTGTGSTGSVFGFVRQATISGMLFDDANANGIPDTGEGAVDPARDVYLLKGTTQVGSPITTGNLFSFGAQDVGATYTVCVASVTGEVQTYPKSNTLGHGDCSSVSGANPVGWQFQLASDGNTTLGFGSLDATAGSCSEPFGNLPFYRIMLNGVDPCDKSFVVSYSDTDSNKSAELRPVAGSGVFPMVEYIQWTLPSDSTQIELQYDDTLDNIAPKEMLQCKIDPRQNTSLIAPPDPDDGSDLKLATPLAADADVFPVAPFGYDASPAGLVTSCIILDIEKDGKYVAYVYSSIDGFRDGT